MLEASEFNYKNNDVPYFLYSDKGEVSVYTNTPVPSQTLLPQSQDLFGRPLSSICQDGKLPAPIIVSIFLGFYSFSVSHNF